MTGSKLMILAVVLGCGAFGARDARAVVSCTIVASPTTLSGAYDAAANLDLQGSFAVNCTRAKNDSKNQTLWIGLNQTAGQTMTKPAPYADTLGYGIYTDSARSTLWTNGVGGGLTFTLAFGTATSAATNVPVYLRANAGQADKAAGSYNDSLNVTLNSTDSVGTNLGNTTVGTQATVAKSCTVDVAPINYSVNYQAFRSTALVDASQAVSVTCSKGTPVSLALDQVTGLIVPTELKYTLTFPGLSQSASGTSASSATAQTFGLTLTLPAGQAGACNAGTCTGSDTRQITVSY
ncbi:spore coat protein U domain-containing protein [Ramlibacter sp.]|uniref:spore coat protein U domain-containing protein n=1 Tax=Ramlibacter sp. TaxID=1917967 RepID=UPI002C0B0BED|nr:spore coat protein U domain-containing protein [Ramlibacter sp.]HWI82602.1 spore coat protein U domain-containing protein [Ramlibacter sp.]